MEDPIRLSNDEAFAKSPVGSVDQQVAPEAVLEAEAPPPPSYVPFKPEDAAHVAWEDIANPEGGADSRAAFVESLRKVGFVFLSLPDSMMGPINSSYEVARQFFAGEAKKHHRMREQRDVGYVNMPHIKEFYQMRYTKSPTEVWPSQPENFKEVALEYYDLMLRITKECFKMMAEGIKVDAEHFVDLLDLEERKEKEVDTFYGSTLFRYFRYKNKPCLPEDEPCKVHTDIGLLTIIPVTTVPQLQMLHPDNFEWIDAEPLSTTKNEVIVFCGEMMERLTMYYYRAVMHRVNPPPVELMGQERYSLVYLCRGRPDAVMDTVKLNSPVLGPAYWEFKEPITIAEFMRQRYTNKESANGLNTMQVGGVGFPTENLKA